VRECFQEPPGSWIEIVAMVLAIIFCLMPFVARALLGLPIFDRALVSLQHANHSHVLRNGSMGCIPKAERAVHRL